MEESHAPRRSAHVCRADRQYLYGTRSRRCGVSCAWLYARRDPGHLNPAITTSGATHAAAELLYNGLLGRDEHGEPHPELAESWQVEQAGALYRFRLRQGVTWLIYAWLDPHTRYE